MYKSNRDIECEIMDRLEEYGIDPADILDNLLRYLDSDTTSDFLKDTVMTVILTYPTLQKKIKS